MGSGAQGDAPGILGTYLGTASLMGKGGGERVIHTYELSRFIWSFVDEGFKRFFHGIDELLILEKANVNYMIDFVLEVEQLLDHGLVFLGINDNGATKCLPNRNVVIANPCWPLLQCF